MFKKIFNMFFNNNKNEVKEESSQEESILDINKLSNTNISFSNIDGWIVTDIRDVLNSEGIPELLERLSLTEKEWLHEIDMSFWTGIKTYSKVELLKKTIEIKKLIYEDVDILVIENIKRKITISSIIFNLAIPRDIIIIDKDTIMYLCRYLLLTELLYVDINKTLPGIDIEPCDEFDINKSVTYIINNNYFKNMLTNIEESFRLPNLAILINGILELENNRYKSFGVKSTLMDLNLVQFKKLLSCIFLSAGIQIPRDYLYLDIDVIDYAMHGHI